MISIYDECSAIEVVVGLVDSKNYGQSFFYVGVHS